MVKYFYNAVTRPEMGTKPVQRVSEYTRDERWGRFAVRGRDGKICDTIEEMAELCAAADFSGTCTFRDSQGKLWDIYQVGSWEFKPLQKDGTYDGTGINWATCWFLTEKAAYDFYRNFRGSQCDKPEYHEKLDTWSVHHHR